MHRIGRTGRAGRSGEAFVIVGPNDAKSWQAVVKLIKQEPEELKLEIDWDEAREAAARDKEKYGASRERAKRDSSRDRDRARPVKDHGERAAMTPATPDPEARAGMPEEAETVERAPRARRERSGRGEPRTPREPREARPPHEPREEVAPAEEARPAEEPRAREPRPDARSDDRRPERGRRPERERQERGPAGARPFRTGSGWSRPRRCVRRRLRVGRAGLPANGPGDRGVEA